MSKKSRKSRRRSPEVASPLKPPNRLVLLGRELVEQATRSPETVLLVLAVVYLVFGLALLGAMGFAINPQAMTNQAPVFGEETSEEETATEMGLEEFQLPVAGTVGYGIMTAALWTSLVLLRRRIGPRQIRFLTLLLTPGTIMFLAVAARLAFLAREG